MLRFTLRLLIACLLAVPVVAEPIISEFMASNQNGITDENGDRPDWIEIRNPDAAAVSMSGWALTDSAANPQKWPFPAVTIPANGYLLVFASGKDRRVLGQNLHTNFNLSAGGEYLALVRPEGTPSTVWSPKYPQQYANLSYGTSTNTTDVTYVQQSTPVRAFVPADTSLIPQWRTIEFNDSAWTAGIFAVGYMNANANPNLSADLGVNFGTGSATPMNGTNTGRHSYSRAIFTVADKSQLQGLRLRMNYDDGFVAWINGTRAANSAGAPTADPISTTALVASHPPGAFEDFPVNAAATAALVNGTNVLAIEGFNQSTSSSDAFILPQLIGTLSGAGAGVTGYFTVDTPGIVNRGVDAIQLPLNVTFSRPSGTFADPFQLDLGGAGPGQEIRYVIADPAASPGANIAQPTIASALYTAPISISTSKLIRAAIFEDTQKSRTLTAQYLQLETGTTGNTSNFSSILPIIVMDDHGAGQPITSESNYTTTMMHIFPPVSGTARLADSVSRIGVPDVFSRAGARVRGSSSAGFAKKSYGVETWTEVNGDDDISLLGMPADSDWILNGPFLFDDTYIHNAFINEISRRIGRWAPRTHPCEVFFNQNGGKLDYADYVGVYILGEKIKSGKDRVDIATIEPGDNTGTALTGGYIFKIDRADGGEVSWTINNSQFGLGLLPNGESGQTLVLVEPDPQSDTPQQEAYIKDTYVLPFNNMLFTERAAAFATRNYRNSIDVPSFIDHHILNALAFNVDALRLSAFFFKDRNEKIQAGPIWDFDRALGSDDGRDSNPSSWNSIGYFFDRDWWGALFKDPQFVQEWVDRWWQLRQPGRPFVNTALNTLADQMGAQIGNAAGARDAARFSENTASGGVYLNEINAMKNWLASRLAFIDNAAPRPPDTPVSSGVVTPGSTVSLSGTGSIRYTLDGTDPRPFGGATGGGTVYSGALTINSSTVLTARRQSTFTPFPNGAVSISWSAPLTRVYLVNEAFAVAGDLAISEVNYHPSGPTPAETAAVPGVGSEDFEWIEIKNVGTRNANTFEMTFPAGYPFEQELRLQPKSLTPGDTVLIVKNRAAFQARYGTTLNSIIVGEWRDGNLSDGGEEIRLLARDGSSVHAFTFSDGAGWPDRADGEGGALEYTGAAYTNADFNNSASWRTSSEIQGSPGANGSGPDSRIVINEILSHSNLPRVDAIELRNNSAASVDVGGWFISDAGSPETVLDFKRFRIPNGTVIPPGAYVVFTEVDFNPNGAWNPNAGTPGPGEFAFDGQHGDDAWLVSADANGNLLKFIDHVDFGAARADESWGRLPNGTGSILPLRNRSLLDESSSTSPRPGLGADNNALRVGPLIIQEIHHSPPGGDNDLEFVELFNPGSSAVPLAQWRLRGDADYSFLPSELIAAGGILVVVPFDPNNVSDANAFRTAYGIGFSVVLAGPWDSGDHLSADGQVVLYRAETPPVAEPYFYPQTIEDETHYLGSGSGWPDTTSGASLNRNFRDVPNSPSSWFADAPTPGSAHLVFPYWESIYFPTGGPGSADHDDFDHDGLDNALEFAFHTNPLVADNLSALLPLITTQPGANGTTDHIFSYTRPLDHPGVTYTVETSSNLRDWSDVADVQSATTETTETREAIVNSAGRSRLYLRLTVAIAQ
ncbi:MAG: lamin tail domain-containing protein [Verrucomicrobiales bacterium]